MWSKTYSKTFIDIDPQVVWSKWIDVNRWPEWHEDLDSCRLEGAFVVGNYFMLKPKGASPVKIFITEVIQGISFTDCTYFFGAQMYDTHRIEKSLDGVVLTNTVTVKGWLAWLWVFLVAKNVAKTVPDDIELFVKQIKKSQDLNEK